MGGLEKEELLCRTRGMTEEELQVAVKLIPDKLLWDELHRRYTIQNTMVKVIKEAVRE